MGVLSNELSSWRKNIVECKKGEVTTLNFRDTRPNVMFVMNPSDSQILCNLDSIPTENHYDFRIKNHYARLVGKPVATSQVYFMNMGDYNVDLQVYSVYDKNFDPSWLADFSIENVNLDSECVQLIINAIKNTPTTLNPLYLTSGNRLRTDDTTTQNYLALITQKSPSIGNENLANIKKKIEDVFNADVKAATGSDFGAVLLANEEPASEQFLGLYNLVEGLNTIATKLDTVATKLDQLIAK